MDDADGADATDEVSGYLNQRRYVLHDRDTKLCKEFRDVLAVGKVKCLVLPSRSPNLNAFAERWVRSVKEECLSKLILAKARSHEHFRNSWNTTTSSGITKGKGTLYFFLQPRYHRRRALSSDAIDGSEDC